MKRLKRARANDYNYTRLAGKDSDEDETELFNLRKSTPHRQVATVEKNVQEGDTLQALSIRYHCPIAELKRLNNIHKENEIFARNTIKVPARPFTTALAGVHDSGNSSPNDKVDDAAIDGNELGCKLENITQLDDKDVNAVIFNSHIATNKYTDVPEHEVIDDLNTEEVLLMPERRWWSCNGADAGISWIALIFCILLVVFVLPIIYVVYVFEHPGLFHHDGHT